MGKKKKLIPPDPKQCQAEKSNGVNFMTLGGRHEIIRCINKPDIFIFEEEPGADGQCGSMSLCSTCYAAFKRRVKGKFRVEPISNKLAFETICKAEVEYLLGNGWIQRGDLDDWSHEGHERWNLAQGHAVNVQKQFDRMLFRREKAGV